MNVHAKWAAAVILGLSVALGFSLWLRQHDAELRATTDSAARQQAAQSAEQTIKSLTSDKEQIKRDADAALAAIAKQRTVVVTVPQATQIANSLPYLPQPVTVQTVPATATTPATQQIVIPQADIPAFQSYKLDCDVAKVERGACLLAAEKDKGIIAAKETQLDLMTADRNQWRNVAHGGTVWHRVVTVGKWALIAGAAGYAAGRFGK